ncbi:hypothetical protein [Sphaerotilus uruguayifluvii]|uniref:TonB C-terminal domain-containing protein n=1 Tax=Sphaerotilus uruguayifluvii TaxID=2735897 RepID=A0ABX2FYX2_9BURK|nr:hypothetical protein [Leptothrix sp. C29]NRT55216.1 hypothetical protein [Leptothrix sp. C29]
MAAMPPAPILLLGAGVLLAHALLLQALQPPPVRATAPPAPAPWQVRLVPPARAPMPPTAARPAHAAAARPDPARGRPGPPPDTPDIATATEARPDIAARPVSAPDLGLLEQDQALAELLPSGLPMRLRLTIDASGQLDRLEALQIDDGDRALLPALQRMFAATRFLPARRGGREIASQLDIELRLDALPAPR